MHSVPTILVQALNLLYAFFTCEPHLEDVV